MDSEVFKALGDPTRLAIIKMLAKEEELCVCKIFEALPISQPGVSKQLRVLKEAGLVNARQDGKWIHYSLDKKRLSEVVKIVEKITWQKVKM